MLSTLIFDECSLQTMLQTKQFANQRFTPNGLLILARDFLSFFRMCEVETKLFHTWWDLDLILTAVGCSVGPLILFHKRHGLYLHPQII